MNYIVRSKVIFFPKGEKVLKRVISILVDSVFAECLSNNKTELSSTPFIDSIVSGGLYLPNVYSFGPYTDAATKGLFTGKPTLSTYGYYYGINSAETNYFKVFKDNGYRTVGVYYPYYLISSKVEQYIDHSIYTSGFKYGSVWFGKFLYYSEVQKNRNLTNQEYELISKCIEMVFDCWELFYRNLREQPGSDYIIKNFRNDEINGTGYTGLIKEKKKYYTNKKSYIDEVLEQGMDHSLAKINDFDYGSLRDREFVAEVYKANRVFFEELAKANCIDNLLRPPFTFKTLTEKVVACIKKRNKTELRFFGNYGMLLFANKLMKERSTTSQEWQDLSSLDYQINAVLNDIDNNIVNKDTFYSLHCLEPHHNISFFSFDSHDTNKIRDELDYLEPLIKGRGKKFRGNLLYQMSLRYVDYCIKRLFKELDNRGILEDTTIMLMADHGTSYFFEPLRTHVVNTFHKENFNIPVLIWNHNLNSKYVGNNPGMFNSSDIYSTLFNILGLQKTDGFDGLKIDTTTQGREYVIFEYMGSGVPDMTDKDVWIGIRNEHYVIAYMNNIKMELDRDHPVLIYNLLEDPFELNGDISNIKWKENEEISQLINTLDERYRQIQSETAEILKNIDSLCVIRYNDDGD